MSKVPKYFIDEAAKRGIVPGAVAASLYNGTRFTVPPYENWVKWPDSEDVLSGPTKDGNRFIYESGSGWATVITPAPSEPEGLKEGDACECGPAMRAAIVELAKELGVRDSGCLGLGLPYLVWWTNELSSYHKGPEAKVRHTPEAFIAKMRVTPAQPKPITIGDHKVEFRKGSVKIGRTVVENEKVRAIAERLIDEGSATH